MKFYVNGPKLSLALPAWIGSGNDTNLATNAVHHIHQSLLRLGYAVRQVEMDGSWCRASQTSEELGYPQEMIAMVHIHFDGAGVVLKTLENAISVAEDAVLEWAVTAPPHIWDKVSVPLLDLKDDDPLTVDDLMELLD